MSQLASHAASDECTCMSTAVGIEALTPDPGGTWSAREARSGFARGCGPRAHAGITQDAGPTGMLTIKML